MNNLNNNELAKLLNSCSFAAKKHRNQRRKDSERTPYINHPIDVANILARAGITDLDTLIGGILHDTIEDTDTDQEEIRLLFGDNVLKIVLECSDDKSLHKVERKKLQIEHASHISNSAKLVKLADKYSNLLDILSNPPSSWSKEEIEGYIIWGYAVVSKLKGINEKLDNDFELLFKSSGIIFENDVVKLCFPPSVNQLNELLEKYYKCIDKSE